MLWTKHLRDPFGPAATAATTGFAAPARRFLDYGPRTRIDLDDVERFLNGAGYIVACLPRQRGIAVVAEGTHDARSLRILVATRYKVQPSHVIVVTLDVMPRTASGSVDHATLGQHLARHVKQTLVGTGETDLREAMAAALSRTALRDDDTFAALGGDSLAYLEVHLALERRLGFLPAQWETKTIAELEALLPRPERAMRVPMHLLVRLAALTAVIALHAQTSTVGAGVFVLLILAGFSLAQFQRENVVQGRAGRVVVTMFPRMLAAYYAVLFLYWAGDRRVHMLWWALLGNLVDDKRTLIEPLWFIPGYVQVVLMFLGFAALPPVRRALACQPWRSGVGVLAGAAVLRWLCAPFIADQTLLMRFPLTLLHLFVLGWCIHHADTRMRKVVVTAAATALAAAFWSDGPGQALFIIGSCVVLVWADGIKVPRRLGHALTVIGSASFFIYIVHMVPVHVFNVLIPLAALITPIPAFAAILAASVVLGLLVHAFANKVTVLGRKVLLRRSSPQRRLAPEW